MHPLFLTIIRRPDLVMDHLSAYAALFKQETNDASKLLMRRVLAWLMAVMFVAIFVVFSGVALMLGVLQNQFHWILLVVPGAMALCALCAFALAKKTVWAERFTNVNSQFLSDAAALRAAAGQ